MTTFSYLFSEDGGKHYRQVAYVGEEQMREIIAKQREQGNDNTGRYRYRFIREGA